MTDLHKQLAEAKTRYQRLLEKSQNPHADPLLQSLKMAIARLEQKTGQQ